MRGLFRVPLLLGVILLSGCGAMDAAYSEERADGTSNTGGAPPSSESGGDHSSAPPPSSEADGTGSGGGVQAGTLTAGVWDDNLNFAHFVAYRDAVGELAGLPSFTPEEQQDARDAFTSRTARSALEIVLAIDTTGSMGDEIKYLQAEVAAIASHVAEAYPGVPQRWALVAYRDEKDEYLVRSTDFTTSLEDFQTAVNQLRADGGGDIPEAPDAALEAVEALSWGTGEDIARLVFVVADAPHHDHNARRFTDAVRALQARDVRVYPVSSSGSDELFEYSMRAAAQLTGGRYLFLTDDSGVGGAHKDPTIPCYWVTRLNYAMERVISSELSGTIIEIDPDKVLRAVGSPVNGQCQVDEVTFVVF